MVALTWKDVWRCALTIAGVLYAMMTGTYVKHKLYADNWVTLIQYQVYIVEHSKIYIFNTIIL